GEDTLIGGSGDDALLGGADNDTLLGGEGNDTLHGDEGDDKLYGQDGNDTLYAGTGNDLVNGGAWNDQLHGEDGNDTLIGGSGDDNLYGGIGDDKLYGGDDSDLLEGGIGNDRLDGGADNDYLNGDAGEDTLIGGSGDDALLGGADNDTLLGGEGNDTLHGDEGNDKLYGQDGNDNLYGGSGNDTFIGGTGDDTMHGGEGDDTAIFTGNLDDYIITRTEDGGYRIEDTVNGRDGTNIVSDIENLQFADGKYTPEEIVNPLTITFNNQQQPTPDWTSENANMDGSSNGTHNVGAELGGSGSATVVTNNDDTDVSVDSGWNTIKSVKAESDESANIHLSGFVRADVSLGDGGDSNVTLDNIKRGEIETGDGNDTVTVNVASNDRGENDRWNHLNVTTNEGDDTITVRNGSQFSHTNKSTILTVASGIGNDTVDIEMNGKSVDVTTDAGTDNVSLAGSYKTASLDTGSEADSVTVTGSTSESLTITTGTGNDSVSIDGAHQSVNIDTGSDNDTISVAGNSDSLLINSGEGADDITVSGNHSSTVVNAGVGNDTVTINGNIDAEVNAGAGNDTVSGSSGNDTIYGADGADTLLGGSGKDSLAGGADNDSLDGGANDDYLDGGSGNDTIYGGAGNDVIVAGNGNDHIYAGAGKTDMVIFSGNRSDYEITWDEVNQGFIVNDLREGADSDGTDFISGAEELHFNDGMHSAEDIYDEITNAGGGNDFIYRPQSPDIADIVDVSTNYNKIDIETADHDDIVRISTDSDEIEINTGDHADTIMVSGRSESLDIDSGKHADNVTISGNFGEAEVETGHGNDTVSVSGTISDFKLETGDQHDIINLGKYSSLTTKNGSIDAGDGHDTIYIGTLEGFASIDGGEGKDSLSFSGNFEDYTITQGTYDGEDGFYISGTGADGYVFVTNIENFEFNGQSYGAADLLQPQNTTPEVSFDTDSITLNQAELSAFSVVASAYASDADGDAMRLSIDSPVDAAGNPLFGIYTSDAEDGSYKSGDIYLTEEGARHYRTDGGADSLSVTVHDSQAADTATLELNFTDSSQIVHAAQENGLTGTLVTGNDLTINTNITSETGLYKSSLGVYFADADGNPISGIILDANAASGDQGTITIPAGDIPEGAETFGYFVAPDAHSWNFTIAHTPGQFPGFTIEHTMKAGLDVTFSNNGTEHAPKWEMTTADGQELTTGWGENIYFSDSSLNGGNSHAVLNADGSIGWEDSRYGINHGGSGDITAVHTTNHAQATGSEHAELLIGSNLPDNLLGNDGNDLLFGHDGNDVLTGGAGSDILTGGHGADTFVFTGDDMKAGTDSYDYVTDYNPAEGDVLDISQLLDTHGAAGLDYTLGADPDNAANSVLSVSSSNGESSHHIILEGVSLESLGGAFNADSPEAALQAMINQNKLIDA
ncbi:type I secretion C-terminal target domain-containing protein, partial [Oleidesulfovibrio sp.]|uniref:calcium-binding protein n=1 Tax=Oleidesulfovibrio sp. TaxID=2909707 RepID=UPI003A8451DE